jgi:hypothetical protein
LEPLARPQNATGSAGLGFTPSQRPIRRCHGLTIDKPVPATAANNGNPYRLSLVTGSFVGSINEQWRSYRPENGILTLH